MRVIQIESKSSVYTCKSYLLLGEWNQLSDVNTLIDPGTDGSVLEQIEKLSTGCGKIPVEQVILTHNHFDHAAGAEIIRKRYGARIFAWSSGKDVDELLHDGQIIKAGDEQLQVFHTPGHSSDSICLYCYNQQILFSGDTQLRIRSQGGMFAPEYLESLRRLSHLKVDTVYSGHDEPMTGIFYETITETLTNIRKN